MWVLFLILFLFFWAVISQGLTIYELNSGHHEYLAVSVRNQDLNEVASSVLMAEKWLRIHVLASYPASKITHIVVGHNLLCFSQTHHFDSVLPALKNLHHSLTRWGLERAIKVSPSLTSHCWTPNLTHTLMKPILHFIQATNSTYLVNPVEEPISDKKTHVKYIKKIEFLPPEKINLVKGTLKQRNPTMRKLSFVIPTLPTPTPEISPAQDFPIAEGPLPPLVGPISFPPNPSSTPHLGMAPTPSPNPAHPRHHLPPCNPWAAPPPTAEPGAEEKMWCVAKPSVPAETLQEAIDYACGEGGAECDEIQPNGNCYYPDSLVAHASFAFNSYWQKTKRHGGTCSFGGTAMLINSDPSNGVLVFHLLTNAMTNLSLIYLD